MTREVERAEQVLTVKHGRRPDDTELAAEIGVEASELAELRGRVHRGVIMAIDPIGDDTRRSSPAQRLYDRCAATPDEDVEFAEVRGYVRDALDRLPDRHRMVAIGYYLEGRSFEELAELLTITPSRVSQLRAEAVIMMRDGIETQYDGTPTAPARRSGESLAARALRRGDRSQQLVANDSSPTTSRWCRSCPPLPSPATSRCRVGRIDAMARATVREEILTMETIRPTEHDHDPDVLDDGVVRIDDIIESANRLEPLTASVTRLAELVADLDVDMRDIVEVIAMTRC
jgi:RNA polymerase sigma factor (sigma-70 family)